MKLKRFLLAGLVMALLAAGCASTTQIQSVPSGAAVYREQQRIGTTPCSYTDQKIWGSATVLTLKHDGCRDLTVTLVRNEKAQAGPIIGGFLLAWPLWLWSFGYDPVHVYELENSEGGGL